MFIQSLIRSLFLASICISIPMRAEGRIGKFTKMTLGHTLLVKYSEQGCFGFSTYHLLFRFGPSPEVLITRRDTSWSPKLKKWIDKGAIGNCASINLVTSDLEGLDKLLDLYRPNPKETPSSVISISTTTETVDLIQMKNGVVIAREHFVDNSGKTHHESSSNAWVSFPDLIQRSTQK